MKEETWDDVQEQQGAVYIEGPVMALRVREVEGRDGNSPDYRAPVLVVWDGQQVRNIAYRDQDTRYCPAPPSVGALVRCWVRLSVWRDRIVTSGQGLWEVLSDEPSRAVAS